MTSTSPLDAGTYEVLRDRLAVQGGELARRAEALNARRIEEFGSSGLALESTGRLRTELPCTPRDIVAVGDILLFGYHASAAVKGETAVSAVSEVFALHDRELNRLPDDAVPGLLDDPDFLREFAALHRYYHQARLLRLRRLDGRLLAVFRTGDTAEDIRVLRWALDTEGGARFLDARGERDHAYPPSHDHDFEWTATTRADHVLGRHPHVSIGAELYVSTVGGALTVKTEDDTETAEGIHSEPVDEPLQSLADADIAYARVGPLILLRVRPYKEETDRHLVFDTLTREIVRLDAIGQAARRLPEDQGIVFPGGYHLATGNTRGTGATKTFDIDAALLAPLRFERTVRSPNGEDLLYVFQPRGGGRGLLLPYNVIRKEVATPLTGHGHALFEDGTLFVLRADGQEPSRVHPVQRWSTPFVSDTYAASRPAASGAVARVGNADLVRGISDCLSIAGAAAGTTPTTGVYESLVAACVRAGDQHHWLDEPELGDLRAPLEEARATAEQVLAEFETVLTLTRQAADALGEAAARTASLVRRARGEAPRTTGDWVERLTELRRAHGHVLTLKERRYADPDAVDALAAGIEGDIEAFARRAVAFLAREDAFAAHHTEIGQLTADAGAIATTAEAAGLTARLDAQIEGLGTVTEVIAGLDIGDTTVRTSILERIAEVLGGVNRARAVLDARRRELVNTEGRAEFAAESALLGQAVTGALAAAGTPEACDEQLSRLLLRLEDLESRFAESDEFLARLAERRSEVHEVLSARKQTLQDARARRAERLADSAARVLDTVARRVAALADGDAVSTFFASDPMVSKVRRIAAELRELGERTRAEELDGRITSARQEAARSLRDRTELYADGGRTLRLGRHRFAVNTQPFDLTLVPQGDGLAFALTGTDYRSPVTEPEFAATRPYWERSLPSESAGVYRSEYLAVRLLTERGPGALAGADLTALVRAAAEAAYDEGYERGVHDHDALLILNAVLALHADAGLLRHPSGVRARAQLFWAHRASAQDRTRWTSRAVLLARARDTFEGPVPAIAELRAELAAAIGGLGAEGAAAYLFDELSRDPAAGSGGFATSAGVRTLLDKFRRSVGTSVYDEGLAALGELADRRQAVEAWLGAYTRAAGEQIAPGDLAEAVAVELCPDLPRYDVDAPLTATVDGLLGRHPRITGRSLTVRIDDLLSRAGELAAGAGQFRDYQRRRAALVAGERVRLRLEDYRAKVLSSFVRGRLVDEVCLPLIGDNLAKQLGTTGEGRRTDSNGLLLLVSPPGYGKTTLMEYVADRLGLVLVKVDGPALGYGVTSLDPARAPDATARREVEKINFALEAGNNTLLYLDDIQHVSAELLQKFIPLCDATRRMEGVWEGEPRTYDLRGKRFAVCMAGNPYTESGERFRIPDMLANRADVWNLGDVLTGKEAAFAASFVENALTSHPVLAPLAGRDRADLELLVRLAAGDPAAGDPTAVADRLSYGYAPAELERILAVLRLLLAARDVVVTVNAAYMASAAQEDATRTEPPFRLQGSYRNMNRIAARIDPVMNPAELSAVIDDHYRAQAQTLTAGAEANLLKLAELRGTLTREQAARWSALKASYASVRPGPGGS
ncbi:DNA repair ATPase [Streptomyces sp. NBC_00503]|uniref:DNA repair ATPase n=1 Tax=Streptomyces sp. NBC_00503 TaxID=2903659 RepID=UPI002E81263C|nr:DNA repair ATPase [Streptomyces sp. NBC_00503]WUD85171.1 DNA repair ATPase [Streptomyces sp. NBC_00503]